MRKKRKHTPRSASQRSRGNNGSTQQNSGIRAHIARASRHANVKWKDAAVEAVRSLAAERQSLTSADVLNELSKLNVETHDLRAMGAVMTEARKLGYIENAGFVRRNDSHNRGTTVRWSSLLVNPTSNTEKK